MRRTRKYDKFNGPGHGPGHLPGHGPGQGLGHRLGHGHGHSHGHGPGHAPGPDSAMTAIPMMIVVSAPTATTINRSSQRQHTNGMQSNLYVNPWFRIPIPGSVFRSLGPYSDPSACSPIPSAHTHSPQPVHQQHEVNTPLHLNVTKLTHLSNPASQH